MKTGKRYRNSVKRTECTVKNCIPSGNRTISSQKVLYPGKNALFDTKLESLQIRQGAALFKILPY